MRLINLASLKQRRGLPQLVVTCAFLLKIKHPTAGLARQSL
jgi:hypothetical protein